MRWTNLALLILSLIVSLIIIEFGAQILERASGADYHVAQSETNLDLHDHQRFFCVGPKNRMLFDPVVKFRERPNSEYFELRNDQANYFAHNEFGYRGPTKPRENRNGVLVLGDSFTRGTLADETETIPAVLTRASNTHDFINMGTGGHGPMQHALAYEELRDVIPHTSVLVLIFLGNDFQDNLRFSKWQSGDAREGIDKLKKSIGEFIQRFAVGRMFAKFWATHVNQSGTAAAELDPEGKELFADAIESIVSQAESKEVFIVTVPRRRDIDRDLADSQAADCVRTEKLEDFIEDLADRHAIPCFT